MQTTTRRRMEQVTEWENSGERCWGCGREGRSVETDENGRVTDVSCNSTTECRRDG